MSNIWKVVSHVDDKQKDDRSVAQLSAVQTRNERAATHSDITNGAVQTGVTKSVTKVDVDCIKTPEDALRLLKSEPATDDLIFTLRRLTAADGFDQGFDLRSPGPLSAQIINAIVSSVVPNFWPSFNREERFLITECLASVAGLNSIVARIQLLLKQSRAAKADDQVEVLKTLFGVANEICTGNDRILRIWTGLQASTRDRIKRDLAWKELANLLGSGKISNVLAEAEDVLQSTGGKDKRSIIANSNGYAAWLGRNIAHCLSSITGEGSNEVYPALSVLLARALSLGHPISLVKSLHLHTLQDSVTVTDDSLNGLKTLIRNLQAFTKRRYLDHTLRWLSSIDSITSGVDKKEHGASSNATAIAALLHAVTNDDNALHQHLIATLSDAALVSAMSLDARNASIAVLAADVSDELDGIIEKGLKSFGDQLFIRHSPILQQESLAQVLLVASGYVHRREPMALLMTIRSSGHMQGVSNRLDVANPRARWLGMVVGMALSSLVDKPGSKLNFGTEDMKSEEAKWYLSLVNTGDRPGTLQELLDLVKSSEGRPKRWKTAQPQTMPKINGKPTFGPLRPPEKRQTEVEGARIAEVTGTDSEDDGLKPYAKPDSDAEDSEEDATLVNRHKPRPPVYIRDLMAMLRDTEKHDRFQIGIRHAATLIRRKSNFGKEVTDHAEELGRILCGLQDSFDTETFDELRLQALIAVVLSDPSSIAPWLGRQAFGGDFSIAQRCVMLTAIGLSGRELAGLREQDGLNPDLPDASFPSKQLPSHLHAVYSSNSSNTPTPSNRLESAHRTLEHSLLQPMALSAADKSTAQLDAVKVRTFSSRMEVERTKRKPAPNKLAQIFAEGYFYPLLNRYQQEITSYGSGSVWSTTPFLLVTLIKTLALLFHASGPATLNLAQLSADFWDLLLSLRIRAVGDVTVLEALLFALLTVLEVNEDKGQVAQEHAKRLIETQQWADLVFERTGEGRLVQQEGKGEEAKVRTLSAAVLVKTGEVIEAHRKMLMGDMTDF
ncbi:hypothetical protein WHR41_05049 [Cladosporium halotolerans]|uniref:Telomere length regulation protein conserved domain-containing protein n=1 Tax=Cladosporium halotolerans TaxID=1052096 RepID=A0AB34KQ37_9PEZI